MDRPIYPQGLSDLSITNEQSHVVDIVAVHGLGSSPTRCWQVGDTHWVRDFLPRSLPQARVFVFGYNANVVNDASRMRIREHAQTLLDSLRDERRKSGVEQRALIFICHSLGGIVVKQALVLANDAQNPLFSDIRRSTYGICFLGTPHRGSDVASWGKILANMSRVAFRNPKGSLLESLKKDSHELLDIAQSFASLLSELQIVSCIEQKETQVLKLLRSVKIMVVDTSSAQLGTSNERCIYLDRDHRGICKFGDQQDPSYRQVFNRIEEMVQQAPLAIAARFKQPSAHSSEPIFMVPFRRNEDFVGRQSITDKLRELLSPKPGLQPRAGLWGLGGIGKTTIAVEFCYQERLAKPERHVFWLYGHSKETFETSYLALYNAVSLSALHSDDDDDDDEARLRAVRNWLDSRKSGDWLIVIDNFDDLNVDLRPYLPVMRGAILFTSRDQRLVGCNGYLSANASVKAEEMSDEEALQTFSQLLGSSRPATEQTSRPLLTLLGNLPLAIAQAAAYIRESPGMTIVEYMEEFVQCKENQSFLLSKGLHFGIDMDKRSSQAVMATWKITMEKIERESPRSMELLKLLSFLNAEEIPENLIREACIPTQNSLQFIEARAPLLRFAMLRRLENGSYRVHRLVGFWVRANLSEEEHERQAEIIVELLRRKLPDDPRDNLPSCTQLLPHATAALGHAERSHNSQHLALLNDVASIYQTKGEYGRALEWYQRALDGREKALGRDHPSTLGTINNMAMVFDNQGEYDRALEWYQRALDGKEKALGRDHPSTLGTINNMALVFHNQGEYDRALEWYQRALDGCEKALGRDHPFTLDTVNNMASVFHNQGGYDRALEWYQRALDGREKALGRDHPSTLDTVNNMAMVFHNQGEYDRALEWYQRALDGKEKALGRDHPSTLDTVNNMAIVFRNQGEHDRALEWYQRALDGKEKALGRDHPSTLDIVNNMAIVFDNQGEHDRALEWYQRALDGKEKALGRDHPSTLDIVNNMAAVFRNQGEYDRALEWYQRAFNGYEKKLGKIHPRTINAGSRLAELRRQRQGS